MERLELSKRALKVIVMSLDCIRRVKGSQWDLNSDIIRLAF